VRGAISNGRPYRDSYLAEGNIGQTNPRITTDNDDYRGMQVPFTERELAHLYGLRVKPRLDRERYATSRALSKDEI
jgi:hypothetical protein